jgi:L-lactate dehydrogenase complex protein LldF
LRGLNEFQHLSFASSLCGACTEACPVKIDLHHHLLQNRRDAVNEAGRPWLERLAFKLWRLTMSAPAAFRWFGGLARVLLRAAYGLGLARTPLDPLRPWTSRRAAPQIPPRSFRVMWKGNHAAK